jgi:hypothetical protein
MRGAGQRGVARPGARVRLRLLVLAALSRLILRRIALHHLISKSTVLLMIRSAPFVAVTSTW